MPLMLMLMRTLGHHPGRAVALPAHPRGFAGGGGRPAPESLFSRNICFAFSDQDQLSWEVRPFHILVPVDFSRSRLPADTQFWACRPLLHSGRGRVCHILLPHATPAGALHGGAVSNASHRSRSNLVPACRSLTAAADLFETSLSPPFLRWRLNLSSVRTSSTAERTNAWTVCLNPWRLHCPFSLRTLCPSPF
jgi:hypothetical protein